MAVADLVIKVEGDDIERQDTKLENDATKSSIKGDDNLKVESSDNGHDNDDDGSDMILDSEMDTKDTDFMIEATISSILPSSPSHSPMKLEDVEMDQSRSSSSRQSTPRVSSAKIGSGPTQFAKHLPRGDSKALKTFEILKSNVYQNSKVGRSRSYEKEAMVCDCRYRHGIDSESMACTEEADCINRLTQVECLKSECQCGVYCHNQRFQRAQYATLEIIETEKKGFGLRAGNDISVDQFIYEYIGEVVEQKEFMKRMEAYRNEGIRHFYFMMLQREEFLDATRKGGIARFVNHSCNPNCYVSKWHVGKYIRMGIFAKRNIQVGEELTFNYNVDRYGNDAQPCYCGEPNCVGSIGGKTQTDIGGMDQLFIDALGIADEVDQLEAKGTRKKKSRHLDEDFTPLLRPIEEEGEIAKVMTAIRQANSNRNILQKLISRIHMTQDIKVQRSLVRLHGFVLMAGILEEWKDDKEIVLLVMGSLARWPLSAKNKVVDSGVDHLVKNFKEQDDAEISSLADDLLSAWETLEMSYRIARKEATTVTNGSSSLISSNDARKVKGEDETLSRTNNFKEGEEDWAKNYGTPKTVEARAPNNVSNRLEAVAPLSRHLSAAERPRSNYYDESRSRKFNESPSTPITPDEYRPASAWTSMRRVQHSADHKVFSNDGRSIKKARTVPPPMSIEEIIRKANEKQAEEAAAILAKIEGEQRAQAAEEAARQGSKGRTSAAKKSGGGSQSPMLDIAEPVLEGAAADRRLKKLVGDMVVRCMSHYKDNLERETFKKHARELTHIICDKEKRSSQSWPPSDGLANGFSKEKAKKIKEFALQYVKKLVARKGQGKRRESESKEQIQQDIFVPVTPPRPDSVSNGHQQQITDDRDTNSMNGDNQTSLDRSNTPISHSTTGAKGSDRTETSVEDTFDSNSDNNSSKKQI